MADFVFIGLRSGLRPEHEANLALKDFPIDFLTVDPVILESSPAMAPFVPYGRGTVIRAGIAASITLISTSTLVMAPFLTDIHRSKGDVPSVS